MGISLVGAAITPSEKVEEAVHPRPESSKPHSGPLAAREASNPAALRVRSARGCWIAAGNAFYPGHSCEWPKTLGDTEPESPLNTFPSPDRKSTRLNSSHRCISYAVFCL